MSTYETIHLPPGLPWDGRSGSDWPVHQAAHGLLCRQAISKHNQRIEKIIKK